MAFDPNEWEIVEPSQPQQQPQFNPSDWEVVPQQQAPQQPQLTGPVQDDFWGRLKNNTVAAANAAFPFADEGAAALRSVIPGYGSYDQELAAIRSGEKDYATLHPYSSGASSLAGVLSTAPLLPSAVAARTGLAAKAGQAALEGGAYGAYQGFGSGEGGLANRANAAEDSALMGALISPAIVGTLGGAAKLLGAGAEKVRPPTQAEEAVANLKLTGGDYRRAGKWKGQGAMGDALALAEQAGILTGDTAPQAVAARNAAHMDNLGSEVSGILKNADAVQGNVQPLIKQVLSPGALQKTEEAIAADYYNAPALREQFSRRLQAINDRWDGTVSGLNEAKRGLGNAWKQGDSGELDRALYSDLKKIIEGQADTLIPGQAGAVRSKNAEYSLLKEIQDAAKRASSNAAAAETRAPKAWGLTSLPVMGSGGYVGSAITGNPAVLATMLAMSGAKTVLNSRVGASALSSTMRGGASIADILARAGDPRLIRSFVDQGGASKANQGQKQPLYQAPPIGGSEARRTAPTTPQSSGSWQQQTPQSSKRPYASPISYQGSGLQNAEQARGSYQDIARALVPAVVQVESNGNSRAVSRAGAMGLMQLMPAMAKAYGVSDPFDPRQNVEGGTKLLADELQRFRDPALALAAFNAGSPRVLKALKRASDLNGDGRISFDEASPYLPKETRAYVAKLARIISA